jgi:hypothetical protein
MPSIRRPVATCCHVLALLCAACFLVSLTGCGSGEPFGYVNVPGKITYDDGSPIQAPHLKLVFIPVNPPPSPDPKMSAPKAKADVNSKEHPDGTIPADEITSHNFGDGLLPGKHKVQIIPFDDKDQMLPGIIPDEYRDAKTTPVEVDTASGELIIKVKKPAAKGK